MFRGKTSLSVREPMIALVTVILLLGFLVTNLSYYYVSKSSLRDTLIHELPLTSNNIYSEIQRDLLRPIFISSLMANDTFVKDWLTEGEQDVDKITRYLDEIRRQYGMFTSFMVSDKTLNYYHFSGTDRSVKPHIATDEWYFRVRDMQPEYEVNVDLNPEQDNALTIFINYKVRDSEGRYLGATGVGLDFDTVANIVTRYEEKFGHHVYFIDEQGQIAIRSKQAFIDTDTLQQAPGMGKIANQMLRKGENFSEYKHDGQVMLVSSRYIPELDWWVVVEYEEAVALAPIRQSLFINTLIGLAVVILTLLIINFTVNRFHRRLESQATRDKLTEAGNRAYFDLMLAKALQRHQREQSPLALIMIDIDHFKRINDSHGHIEGDRVIRQVAEVIQRNIRSSDILCRWGGEELVVLAHNCQDQNALRMADQIRDAISAAVVCRYQDGTPLSVSCGVTEASLADDELSLVRRVDNALYQAKNDGRNCTRYCPAV